MDNKEAKKIKELLEKNLAMTAEIQESLKKVNKFIFLTKVMSVIKIIIIVAPIIFAIIYLPPLIQDLIGKYQGLLSGGTTLKSLDINSLLKNLSVQK